MESYAPQTALAGIWELVRRANAYIEEEKPWVLAREEPKRVSTVLFEVLEAIRQVAVLAWPVIPGKSTEILEGLGLRLEPGKQDFEALLSWGTGWDSTIVLNKAGVVFPKYTDEDLAKAFDVSSQGAEQAKGMADSEGAEQVTGKSGSESAEQVSSESGSEGDRQAKGEAEMLTFDEFQKLELKLARVLEAERVEGTDKLLKLVVDLGGGEQRPMVAGIAKAYSADELKGRTIVVVSNLEPAKIRGVESRAMLLAASGDEGLAILVPDREMPPGTRIR
jgi:methionyl-tRNA synthetase